VYALICAGRVFKSDFAEEVKSGWWQSSYILDSTPWYPESKRASGGFSNMTSQEFAAEYEATWHEAPSYLAAAQFAAFCGLSQAIEMAASLNPQDVAAQLRNISLYEFYADISFGPVGTIAMQTVIVQLLEASDAMTTPQAVYPDQEAIAHFVFPKPTWAQQRCRTVTSDCYGHGKCTTSGTCACDEGWSGTACEKEVVVAETNDIIVLLTIAFASVIALSMFVLGVWSFCRCHRRLQRSLLERLTKAIAQEDHGAISSARRGLACCGWSPQKIGRIVRSIRERQSEESGISLAYLLSTEFLELAQRRTGVEDPTFYELGDAFFLSAQGIGACGVCPRDGELGCSFVDTLPPKHRQEATHFLSWTWGYTVSTVREALQSWLDTQQGMRAEDVFLFMCFFVNNQYRILVEKTRTGADVLGATFENQLLRIGRVIAILDTWNRPKYLTRIWTIFEQSCAIRMDIPVTMILPPAASSSLLHELQSGTEGIFRVQRALTQVDCMRARARSEEDEEIVKDFIGSKIGFDRVDEQVTAFMITFIGGVVENHMKQGVSRMKTAMTGISLGSCPSKASTFFSWFAVDPPDVDDDDDDGDADEEDVQANCRFKLDMDVHETPADFEFTINGVRRESV